MARRTLVWALVLSLVTHLVASIFIHPISHVEASAEPTRVTIATVVATPKPPPPTPKPKPEKPQPPRHSSSAIRPPTQIAANKPDTPTQTGPGPGIGPAGKDPSDEIGPTGSPEPTPSPKPLCSNPEQPASTVTAMTPDVPDDAQQRSGRTQVRVDLSDTGAVLGVTVYASSGDMALDRVALSAARRSTYRPELHNCLPIRGSYLFNVDFQE